MNLRNVLTRYGIEYREKGPNCSKGFINVSCPLCGRADPSFHCRISEELTGWYCLRNVKHSGSGLSFLFYKLGIPKELIPESSRNDSYTPTAQPNSTVDTKLFSTFLPADQSEEMISYLYQRKFLLPKEVCIKFQLKYSPIGRWAGRLLIPLSVGWTGRAVREWIEPRYLAETDGGFFLSGRGETAVIVEGCFDAIKLATAVSHGITYIAMTGGYVSPSILFYLREQKIKSVYTFLDFGVGLSQKIETLSILRNSLPTAKVKDVPPPAWLIERGDKDAADFTEDEARQWVYSNLND